MIQLPAWALRIIISNGADILRTNLANPNAPKPKGLAAEEILKILKENYDPSYTPPPGMPDENGKGEYHFFLTNTVRWNGGLYGL